MDFIDPINFELQQEVVNRTTDFLRLAEQHYGQEFQDIPVLFDLRGRCSGMYRVKGVRRKGATRSGGTSTAAVSNVENREIRYNAHIFAKYYADNLATTVPHEVAHYVTDCLYGLRNIRPHGEEWRAVMGVFKTEPSRTANYDLSGIPVRTQRAFDYCCACQNHRLSVQRHNKLLRGQARYHCRQCKSDLQLISA